MSTQDTPMTALITGGTGFVMSNVVKHLLETDPQATAIVLDLGPAEGTVADFWQPVRERVIAYQGDIRDRALLDRIATEHPLTHIVHAAMIAHLSPWEQASPAKYIDVNVMGTVTMLEWARQLNGLQRFLYVSSGDVYGEPQANTTTDGPHRETDSLDQPELYAISKYASEQIVRRYGELFGLDTCRVRFSGVFGPMDRPTPGRGYMAEPYHMVRSVIEQRPLRISSQTPQAGGDFISAEDIAHILPLLLRAPTLKHDVYNIAYGQYIKVSELLAAFKVAVPTFAFEVAETGPVDIDRNASKRWARWNAYAIDRLTEEFGWRPRPIAAQLQSYFDWVMEEPHQRCPKLPDTAVLSV